MLAFHPIRLEDKTEAEACLSKQNYRLCEHCFTDLFIWKDHYNADLRARRIFAHQDGNISG